MIGTAAAALCPLWPAGAQLLIRFTGPRLWWLLRVARWAAGVPGSSVPVPSGLLGVVTVAAAGVAVVALGGGAGSASPRRGDLPARVDGVGLSGRRDTIGGE